MFAIVWKSVNVCIYYGQQKMNVESVVVKDILRKIDIGCNIPDLWGNGSCWPHKGHRRMKTQVVGT